MIMHFSLPRRTRRCVETAPTRTPWNPYLRRARPARHRYVVFPAFHTDYVTANRELARIVARWRPRLIGFAMVNAKQCGPPVGNGPRGGHQSRLSQPENPRS